MVVKEGRGSDGVDLDDGRGREGVVVGQVVGGDLVILSDRRGRKGVTMGEVIGRDCGYARRRDKFNDAARNPLDPFRCGGQFYRSTWNPLDRH